MDWMCFPKFTCWSPNPQCNDMWRWGFYEVITFRCNPMFRISVHIKRGRNQSSFFHLWGHIKMAATWKLGWEPGACLAYTWSWTSHSSRTVKNSLLFMVPGLWYFIFASWTKTMAKVAYISSYKSSFKWFSLDTIHHRLKM